MKRSMMHIKDFVWGYRYTIMMMIVSGTSFLKFAPQYCSQGFWSCMKVLPVGLFVVVAFIGETWVLRRARYNRRRTP